MTELADFMENIPAKSRGNMRQTLRCKHDIIAEWCSECKRLDSPSIKQVLLMENLAIVENLLSWPTKSRTTSR